MDSAPSSTLSFSTTTVYSSSRALQYLTEHIWIVLDNVGNILFKFFVAPFTSNSTWCAYWEPAYWAALPHSAGTPTRRLHREWLHAGIVVPPLGKPGGNGNKDGNSGKRIFTIVQQQQYLASVWLQVQLKKFLRGENCAGVSTAGHLAHQHKVEWLKQFSLTWQDSWPCFTAMWLSSWYLEGFSQVRHFKTSSDPNLCLHLRPQQLHWLATPAAVTAWSKVKLSEKIILTCSWLPSLSPFNRDTFLSCFGFCLHPVLLPEKLASF